MRSSPPTIRLVSVNDVYSLDHLPHLAGLVRRAATELPADLLLVTVAGDFVGPACSPASTRAGA